MQELNNVTPINLADFFHPHGFHGNKGKYLGIRLKEKLGPIVKESVSSKKSIKIDLDKMKTLFGSFVDGAFGIFIDRYGEQFYTHFNFVGGRPEFQNKKQEGTQHCPPHIIPISKCGGDELDNLQLLHWRNNNSKSNGSDIPGQYCKKLRPHE